MRPRTSQPRSISHLIGSVLLLLGMAAMHHLVTTGCVAVMVDHASLGSDVHATDHVVDEPASGVPGEVHDVLGANEMSDTGAPVDHAGAALCLAVIVGAWLLTPLLRYRRVPRAMPSLLREPATMVAVPPRPPDLSLLSVRRT